MAKKTQTVKPGDSYANLGYDPKELMSYNPGVPKLVPGREIYVPAKPSFVNASNHGGYREDSGVDVGSTNNIASTVANAVSRLIPTMTQNPPDSGRRSRDPFSGSAVGGGAIGAGITGKAPGLASPARNPFNGLQAQGGTTNRFSLPSFPVLPGMPTLPQRNPPGGQFAPLGGMPQMTGTIQGNPVMPVVNPSMIPGRSGYPGFQTPTSSTASNRSQSATVEGFRTPTSTTSFTPASNQQNLMPARPVSEKFDPSDPASNAEWRKWWEWQARNPQAAKAMAIQEAQANGQPIPGAPVVMTPEQIWNMKAEQRRREMESNDEDGLTTFGSSGFAPSFSPSFEPWTYENRGNPVQNLSWRVNG